jgi:D-alanyl-D-alanine carboxypeptidase
MIRPVPRLWILLCGALVGMAAAPAPAQVDVEPDRHARLAAVLDSLRSASGATGMSAAVILPDETMWAGASGEAWSGMPATPETMFDIGSITKSYTAALVLRLAAEGRLSLHDSIGKWVPELVAGGAATVRDLLQQTSGIADYASHPDFLAAIRAGIAGPWAPADNLRYVGAPRFPPGERWEYSNTNFLLLGLAAQRAAGRPYAELLRTRLLDSLGLTSTYVAGDDVIPPMRAHAYLDFTGDGLPDDLSALVPDPAFTRGAGGAGAIVATAADLARFARAYYAGAIVPPALRQPFAGRVERGDGWRYGFGLIEAPDDSGVLLGHLGNTAGQSAGVWHDPESNITVALLSNLHAVRLDAPVRRLLEAARR